VSSSSPFARPFVGFGGSRSLPRDAGPFVRSVVSSVVSEGFGVAVGCSVGLDQVVLRARLGLPFPLSTSGPGLVVFSAFGPDGAGSWRGSAVPAVQAAAKLAVSPGHGCCAPVSVLWWAGKRGRLVGRLKGRSASLVSFLSVHRRKGFCAFVGGGWSASPGTWATVRRAVQAGVPVVVFPFAFVSGGVVAWGSDALARWPSRRLPPLVKWCGPGSWRRVWQRGLFSSGFRWSPRP
jgi:hypothetical protein